MHLPIGIMTDSLRVDLPAALAAARRLGAAGVQLPAVAPEVHPDRLDAAQRLALRRQCAALDLQISALCGDLGGYGLERAADNAAKVQMMHKIVDLAADLGSPVVTTHIGVVPSDPAEARYTVMAQACRQIGDHAVRRGVTLAIETGPEPATVLRAFLDYIGSEGVGVNLDPANLVMVLGADPVAAVQILADRIVHTHAKDGLQLAACDPLVVYHAFAEGGFAALQERMGQLFSETPLGQGAVDWPAYLQALRQVGYQGFLTIEREVGADPEADIAAAISFLNQQMELNL